MKLEDLKQDKHNYRKHNDRNITLIRKSVDDCGLGRSIVIDKNNEIVAGNGLVSAISKNTPVKVIETDGSELVVVKRTDLDTNDEKRKKLNNSLLLHHISRLCICLSYLYIKLLLRVLF